MNFYKAENKKFSEENDRLRAENIGYWLENATLRSENGKLKAEIKRLTQKRNKQITCNISMNKEDFDSIVKKVTENILDKQEHKCTPECFGKHVIKAIQNDYDSCSKKSKPYFLMYWYDNLSAYCPWLEKLYIIDGKIYFKSKESST